MGQTKRWLEAQEADYNQHIRLCLGCGERATYDDQSWVVADSISGPVTTVWLCSDCAPEDEAKCADCGDNAIAEAPICVNCLKQYREQIEQQIEEASCSRCHLPIPVSEWEEYEETGMCGWCSHQTAKVMAEVDDEPRETWSPQQELDLEEKKILTPDEFLGLDLTISVDLRLLAYLHNNPKEIYGLTPRQFEELVAELLAKSGFQTKLGPRGRDDGVDVFAERETDLGPELVIVQVKRYREDRKIGQPIIKQLHADVSDRDASKGLLVTSSSFSRDAQKYIDLHKYKLAGKDFEGVKKWIAEIRRSHTN